MRLLSFELKKIVFSKKFLYLMLLIIIGIASLFLHNIIFEAYVEKEELQTIEAQIKTSQSNSRAHRTALEKDPDNETEEKLQAINRPILDALYELVPILKTDDWESKLTLQNEILMQTVEYKEEGGDHPLSFKEISHTLSLNQKLLDEGIVPEHETYSIAWPNFMKQVVDLFINLGALIIILLLIGETLSSEFENHSINLLFTQPLKKTRIIMSKFWSSVILYLFTTGILLGSTMVIGFVFGEKGTFNYPLLIDKNNAIGFLTISEYMIQAIVVVSATIVMVIALYLLYSLLFKHTLSTLFVLLGTLLGGYAFTVLVSWSSFAWFNPFQYLMPGEAILFQNDRVWYQGIPIILLLTVVFYWIATRKIKSSKIE